MDAETQAQVAAILEARRRERDIETRLRAMIRRWEAGERAALIEPPKSKPEQPPENPPARWLVPEDKQVKCKTCGAEMDECKLRSHWKERHWYAYRALQGRLNNAQRQREQEFRISSRPQKETWADMSGLGRIER